MKMVIVGKVRRKGAELCVGFFNFRAEVIKMQAERSQQNTQRRIQRTSKYVQKFIEIAEKKREKAQGT